MTKRATALFAAENRWESILESPNYFLHGIDLPNRSFCFIKTTRKILSSSSFLDGRTPISTKDQPALLPIDEVLSWHKASARTNAVNRFIFHMSFCGSTLVSRMLEQPGAAITYKEPQILLELAELKAANSSWYRDSKRWSSLIGFVLTQLNEPWSPSEAVVIKPSNWANSMLPQLIGDAGRSRALFLSTSQEDFLTSIFRGGGERIKFTYTVLNHLLTSFPEFRKVVADVQATELSTPDMFARLSLIVYAIQSKAFALVDKNINLAAQHKLSYQELRSNPKPYECLEPIANALDLSFDKNKLQESALERLGKHSKITKRSFSLSEAQSVDLEVLDVYGETFSRSYDWAEKNLLADKAG